MTILSVQSSIQGEQSVSRRLVDSVVQSLLARDPERKVVERDVVAEPLAHLAARPDASDPCLAEFLAADTVVVGAPMYNFAIPSQLKAWLDRLAVPGATFNYVDGRPVGKCGDKKVILVSARAGGYGEGSPIAFMEHQESHVVAFFKFLGVTDLEIVRAEGYGANPEATERTVAAVSAKIPELV